MNRLQNVHQQPRCGSHLLQLVEEHRGVASPSLRTSPGLQAEVVDSMARAGREKRQPGMMDSEAMAGSLRQMQPGAICGEGRFGFLMSLEAACSLLLLIISIPLFSAPSLQKGSAHDFFLCSDAAVVLLKSGAFLSQGALEEKARQASALSGLCISASSPGAVAFPCQGRGSQEFSLSFPLWQSGTLSQAAVSCWRE